MHENFENDNFADIAITALSLVSAGLNQKMAQQIIALVDQKGISMLKQVLGAIAENQSQTEKLLENIKTEVNAVKTEVNAVKTDVNARIDEVKKQLTENFEILKKANDQRIDGITTATNASTKFNSYTRFLAFLGIASIVLSLIGSAFKYIFFSS